MADEPLVCLGGHRSQPLWMVWRLEGGSVLRSVTAHIADAGAWLASRREGLCERKVSKKCAILGVDEEPKLAEEVCAPPPADALLPKP